MGGILRAVTGPVLVEAYVEHPVKLILDRPVTSNQLGNVAHSTQRATGDIMRDLHTAFACGEDRAFARDFRGERHAAPALTRGEVIELATDANSPNFEAPVRLVGLFVDRALGARGASSTARVRASSTWTEASREIPTARPRSPHSSIDSASSHPQTIAR